jgi:hypothetical protein
VTPTPTATRTATPTATTTRTATTTGTATTTATATGTAAYRINLPVVIKPPNAAQGRYQPTRLHAP